MEHLFDILTTGPKDFKRCKTHDLTRMYELSSFAGLDHKFVGVVSSTF